MGEPEVCARPTHGISTSSSSSACSRAVLRALCLISFERGSRPTHGMWRLRAGARRVRLDDRVDVPEQRVVVHRIHLGW